MQICVITPISHLHLAYLGGGMHMALTHLVGQNDEYTKFYQKAVCKGEYVILDNSAFELEQQGKGLDPEPVLKASKAIGVHEVIATDVLLDGDKTVASTRNFIAEYNKFYGEEIRLGRPSPKIMAVPQGKTAEEWLDCYIRLLITPGVDVIGLSKISVPTCFGGPNARKVSGGVVQSRLKLLSLLNERNLWPTYVNIDHQIDIHLLGGDDWSGHEIRTVNSLYGHQVRSNDTSAPVWYGAHGLSFDPFTGKAPRFLVEKPDLENHRQTTAENIEKNLAIVLSNIAIFNKMCYGTLEPQTGRTNTVSKS